MHRGPAGALTPRQAGGTPTLNESARVDRGPSLPPAVSGAGASVHAGNGGGWLSPPVCVPLLSKHSRAQWLMPRTAGFSKEPLCCHGKGVWLAGPGSWLLELAGRLREPTQRRPPGVPFAVPERGPPSCCSTLHPCSKRSLRRGVIP